MYTKYVWGSKLLLTKTICENAVKCTSPHAIQVQWKTKNACTVFEILDSKMERKERYTQNGQPHCGHNETRPHVGIFDFGLMFVPNVLWHVSQNLYVLSIPYTFFCCSRCFKYSAFPQLISDVAAVPWRGGVRFLVRCSMVTVGRCWDEELGWNKWGVSAASDAVMNWASVRELVIGDGGR